MDKKILVISTNGHRVLCKGAECTRNFKEFEECLWCSHFSSTILSIESDAADYNPCMFFAKAQTI